MISFHFLEHLNKIVFAEILLLVLVKTVPSEYYSSRRLMVLSIIAEIRTSKDQISSGNKDYKFLSGFQLPPIHANFGPKLDQ
jgi:hypothetical protein